MTVRAMLVAGWLLLLPGLGWAQALVIREVNVLAMHDGSVREGQTILVRDGRIEAVLSPADAEALTAPREVDGGGAWVIPGLAEMHAHVPPRSRGEQYARDVLALYLANGVTTVRGMLGEAWHLELRDRLASGAWHGPRLVTSGPSFNGDSVTSPAQAAERVRLQAAAGYDFLKLHPGLMRDEFEAIAMTARELGIPFAGHVSFDVGLAAALASGQATIDHLDGYAEALVPSDSPLAGTAPQWFGLNLGHVLDPARVPDLARATARAGVWNVPTQSLMETSCGETPLAELMARPGMEYLSPELAQRWRQAVADIRGRSTPEQRAGLLAARRTLLAALQESGAGLLLGSDAPQIMNVPGFSVHQELQYLVAAGLSPLAALQSGTLNVARFLGRVDAGEVSDGMVADFVLLRGNPLQDIRATASIVGVVRAGEWLDRAELDRWLAEVRQRGL